MAAVIPVSVQFVTDEIVLRNMFIQNPSLAVDRLVNAVVYETDSEDAAAMSKFLYTHGYMTTVSNLYLGAASNNSRLKDGILQLIGNMLASVDPDLKFAGRHFVFRHIDSIFAALSDQIAQNNASYAICNFARSCTKKSIPERFLMKLAEVFNPDFLTNYSKEVQHDLLWSAEYIQNNVISLDFILEIVSSSNISKKVLAIACTMLADECTDRLGVYADIAYRKITQDLLLNDNYNRCETILSEAIFALSNVVVESELADKFLDDQASFDRVIELTNHNNKNIKVNAIWVLMNSAVRCSSHVPQQLCEVLEKNSGVSEIKSNIEHTLGVIRSRRCGTPTAPASPMNGSIEEY